MDAQWIPWADAALLLSLIGLFTGTVLLTRNFIAHRRAFALWEPDRTVLIKHITTVERTAWRYMAWPCAVGLVLSAAWRTLLEPTLLQQPWALAIWGLLAVFITVHLVNGRLHSAMQRNAPTWGVSTLRIWSLVPGLLLAALVLIATHRELRWYQGLLLLLLGAGLLVLALRNTKNDTPHADDRKSHP
ncbi:MAG TPA: hypothetical protein VGE21_08830 [Flavobacteriales bacterium]